MPLHLYGVLDAAGVPATSVRGLDGRAVRTLSLGARDAWVSDIAESRIEATPQRVREHDAVLREAIAIGYSIVPSLFGRLYADDATLAADLERNAAAIDGAITLVRGRVEMSFLIAASGLDRVSASDESMGGGPPGREHLLRIRNRIQAERILRDSATELAQSATRALGELFLAERVVENPAPPVLVARAHLVTRDNIVRYLQAVKLHAAAADRALRIVVRGPGAAYSFAAVQIG